MTDSRALGRFRATYSRAEALCDLYARLLRIRLQQAPNRFQHSDVADLLRSSVVLSVAAMDSYFTNRFIEMLVPFLKKRGPTDALVGLLSKAGLDTKAALEMLGMERPYRRVRTLIDVHLEKVTTQRAQVIDELFLAYGLRDFTHHCQRRLKRTTLVASVNRLVERRHCIVHEGDLNSHGRLRPLERGDVVKRMQHLRALVESAHILSEARVP